MSELRVVSLIASATEIVCAIGARDSLVGISHECDYPSSIVELPRCTRSKVNPAGTSGAIDATVRSILQEGLSVYHVDAALLDSLQPDVIITQTQCDVCAVSLRDVEEAVCAIVSSRPDIVSLEPNNLAGVFGDIQRVAMALGIPGEGRRVAENMIHRIEAIRSEAAAVPARPTVACIEWIEPLMSAGNWMPELVEIAGGTNLFGVAGAHSPRMAWRELVEADPDVIVILPCGWGIGKAASEMHHLTLRDEWENLSAVREGRVFVTDGSQYFNRPGPRLAESAEILAEILHPSRFRFGYAGTGWADYAGLQSSV